MATILSETKSVCPVCLCIIPAFRVAEGENIYLEKSCPQHGAYRTLIWQGRQLYMDWTGNSAAPKERLSQPRSGAKNGCPYDCGLCPEHENDTCVVLVEVTNRCNLSCPICFASSDKNPDQAYQPDLRTIRGMFQTLVRTAGHPPLQLSGGEPTLRDDLPDIVALGVEFGLPHIQVNTNGIRIAGDRAYLSTLKQAGLSAVYLQWDGMDNEVYRRIRGADLIDIKRQALDNCAELGIGVILVPTLVPGVNDHQIGSIIRFAKEQVPVVKGVHFQPVGHLGRYPGTPQDGDHLTIPMVLELIGKQTEGEVSRHSFAPSKCENPICSFSGFFVLGQDGRLVPATAFKPAGEGCCGSGRRSATERSREYLTRNWRYREQPPVSGGDCNCCSGSWADFYQRASTHYLCISGMAFQDAWDFDIERIKRCCIHVLNEAGKLIPFCANYLTSVRGKRLYPPIYSQSGAG